VEGAMVSCRPRRGNAGRVPVGLVLNPERLLL
jgi:hypothetical protein